MESFRWSRGAPLRGPAFGVTDGLAQMTKLKLDAEG